MGYTIYLPFDGFKHYDDTFSAHGSYIQCHLCNSRAIKRCDYVDNKGTCNASLCRDHAKSVGKGIDNCISGHKDME